ncbi:MAG: hypothetical protein N2117_03805 [Anaerolineales bacterium]|nr:hypothetical protein [Anaerolineales bacterium]MCX7754356.1 hypothetical protein [Anaerolineales bacterium]MDW8277878.1 hypothetical protein [Anaerolineales bacterium]
MELGMLWLDAEKTLDVPAMIANAAAYYRKKYGRMPNLCFLHPSLLEKAALCEGTAPIAVKPDKTILPGLLWIGVEDGQPGGSA